MLETYEMVADRIRTIASVGKGNQSGAPLSNYWENQYMRSAHMLVDDSEVPKIVVEAGVIGRRNIFGRMKRSGEHIYWLTDRTTRPPVTRWIINTAVGNFAGVFAGFENTAMLHDINTLPGQDIIDAMFRLLGEHSERPTLVTTKPLVPDGVFQTPEKYFK